MRFRTTLILGAVALGLLAFIVLSERHTFTTGALEGRSGNLLQRFDPLRVEGIQIDRDGATVRLSRERRDPDEVGTWRMRQPHLWRADQNAVGALLAAVANARPERTLLDVTPADRRQLGLAHPRLRLVLDLGKAGRRVLLFGDVVPALGGRVVQLHPTGPAYLVGDDLAAAVDHDPSYFRDDALLPDGLPGVRRLDVTGASGGDFTLDHRGDGRWWVTAPGIGGAASGTMWALDHRAEAAVGAFADLQASRFVTDRPDGLVQYGLDRPVLVATATLAGSVVAAGDRGDTAPVHRVRVLRVGAPCAAEPSTERYARVDDGPVACVPVASLAPLQNGPRPLRDLRPLPLVDTDIREIELRTPAGRLSIAEDPHGFTLTTVERGRTRTRRADEDALARWWDAIRSAEATDVRSASRQALAAHGLARPAVLARFVGRGDAGTVALQLGEPSAEGVWARRDGEPVLLRLPARVAEMLTLSTIYLRPLERIDEPERALRTIAIRRLAGAGAPSADVAAAAAAPAETLGVRGGRFYVEAPVTAPANEAVAATLAKRLAHLEAVRFVRRGPIPSDGLAAPRYVVEIAFEGGGAQRPADGAARVTHRLVVGAPTDGGAFAQLDTDPAVFVVSKDLVAALREPLLALDLLATSAEDVASFTVKRADGSATVRRHGGGWRTSRGAAADLDHTNAVLAALESLRASQVVAYGRPPAVTGLAHPSVSLIVHPRPAPAGSPVDAGVGAGVDAAVAGAAPVGPSGGYTLTLGASGPIGTYIRRSGLDATFLVPSDALRLALKSFPL